MAALHNLYLVRENFWNVVYNRLRKSQVGENIMVSLNTERHTFRSPEFRSVVEEAIAFFEGTPVHELPPPGRFAGCGAYALYYLGGYELYAGIARPNRDACVLPIYVGKAVPPGWRAARVPATEMGLLYGRLREHARNIQQTRSLDVGDFRCRFVILQETAGDLIVPVEAALIRKYRPLWNSVIDGFGNHDPGKGRYNQARSEWDVLHPGRLWADRLTGESPVLEEAIAKIQAALG